MVRERGLTDYPPAKELVATMAAIDALILVDRSPGILNRVSTEKLARKGYALYTAIKPVVKEIDWKRPSGASGQKWKSKVAWGDAKGIDPALVEDDSMVIRELEDEMRKEIERDATLLKAKIKLEERAPVPQEGQ